LYAYVKNRNILLSYVANLKKNFLKVQETPIRPSAISNVLTCIGSGMDIRLQGLAVKSGDFP
jgi:hypothetical protein